MAQFRIIDADGRVMELDRELSAFIGPPYQDVAWHQSCSFWPGPTMGGFLRALRKPGGGSGPNARL